MITEKKKLPKIIVEDGANGQIGVLRDLRQIQLSIPDKDFFITRLRNRKKKEAAKKEGGFFSGLPFRRSKAKSALDINRAIEKVKSFHNSFKAQDGKVEVTKTSDGGIMSIAAMNDFRSEVKAAAAQSDADYRWKSLEAIIRFIDLKNSGIVKDRQQIQLDCLHKIGQALHEDGGLSMFNATWFLTVYRDYLSGFRMFRPGEVEYLSREGGQKARNILKKLQRKQIEIPVYLTMISEKSIDVKLLTRYSKEEQVKRSKHGHKGCTRAEIRKLFQEADSSSEAVDRIGKSLEINIIMAYAMVFARIPMLFEVVESIKSAIPKNITSAKLYHHKIEIAQKFALLDIARVVYKYVPSQDDRKLYQVVIGIYKKCADVIAAYNLDRVVPDSAVQTFPIIKQATLLIVYRKILNLEWDRYKEMLLQTAKQFDPIKRASKSADPTLIKIARFADEYQLKLEMIEYEMRQKGPEKQKKIGHPDS